MTRILLILAGVVLAMIPTGCTHKEIVCPASIEREVNVLFEWDNAPEADPEGMTLCFFPADNTEGRIWRFDIAGRDGGKVLLPAGTYSMLAFNNDTRNIDFENINSFVGYTAFSALSSGNATRIPDMLWRAVVTTLQVTPCGVVYTQGDGTTKECGNYLVRAHPEVCVSKYRVIITGIDDISRIKSVSALLSGLDSGVRLYDISPAGQPCGVPFSMSVTGEGTLEGSLRGFSTAFGQTQVLSLRILLNDGTVVSASYNVSEQILNNPNPRDVTILITGPALPGPDTPPEPEGPGDSGLDVGVDGWAVVIIDLTTDV